MPIQKILIVDDEPEVVDILRQKLERDGFHALTAASGRDAILQTRLHLPDLVLMDIVLPDMDGSEVVKTLHDHSATVGIPVIFLSGIISENETGEAATITVAGRTYEAIGKPFTYHDLRRRIDHIASLAE